MSGNQNEIEYKDESKSKFLLSLRAQYLELKRDIAKTESDLITKRHELSLISIAMNAVKGELDKAMHG